MDVLGKARRRRENFKDLALKIIDFTKKIDEKRPLKPQNFLGAEGADYLSSTCLVHTPTSILLTPPLLESVENKGGLIKSGGLINEIDLIIKTHSNFCKIVLFQTGAF